MSFVYTYKQLNQRLKYIAENIVYHSYLPINATSIKRANKLYTWLSAIYPSINKILEWYIKSDKLNPNMMIIPTSVEKISIGCRYRECAKQLKDLSQLLILHEAKQINQSSIDDARTLNLLLIIICTQIQYALKLYIDMDTSILDEFFTSTVEDTHNDAFIMYHNDT